MFEKLGVSPLGPWMIGVSFAFCIFFALSIQLPRMLSAVGGFFSRFSYSLYLIHLPVLTLLIVPFIRGNGDRLQPGPQSFALLVGMILAAYAIAFGFYCLTERNTPLVRKWLKRFSKPSA
jgi:peptidoglycan/LPS O-acetylase OafA/YrhL